MATRRKIPILFSTAMVQAILAGRKTETRRVVKPQPIDSVEVDGNFYHGNHKGYVKVDGHPNWRDQFTHEFCPYGAEGDLMYVREEHYRWGHWVKNGHTASGRQKYKFVANNDLVRYCDNAPEKYPSASMKNKEARTIGWYKRNARFMPKSAARIWLQRTDTGLERVQEITVNSAVNEGIEYWNIDLTTEDGAMHADYKNYTWRDDTTYQYYHFPTFADPIYSFMTLWQKINGIESWERNEWVWVIKYKVLSTTGKPENI